MRSRWKKAMCLSVGCNKEQPLVHNPSKGPKFICIVCRCPVYLPSSRGAKPTRSKHTGAMFPSIEESKREPHLLALERGGAITDLRMQAWRERRATTYRLDVWSDEAVLALVGEVMRTVAFLTSPMFDGSVDSAMLVISLNMRIQDLNRSKHHVTTYTPDAEYRDGGELVVEDVKSGSGRMGAGEATFVMKKRLMLACHGIQVRAVRGSGKAIFGKRQGG